jgi:undecaprenyl pyrophosphate synthase
VDATTQIDVLGVQIADGAKRIEHQRTIVQSLRTDGHSMLADEAEEFLSKLLELQSNYIDQLARLQSPSPDQT